MRLKRQWGNEFKDRRHVWLKRLTEFIWLITHSGISLLLLQAASASFTWLSLGTPQQTKQHWPTSVLWRWSKMGFLQWITLSKVVSHIEEFFTLQLKTKKLDFNCHICAPSNSLQNQFARRHLMCCSLHKKFCLACCQALHYNQAQVMESLLCVLSQDRGDGLRRSADLQQ